MTESTNAIVMGFTLQCAVFQSNICGQPRKGMTFQLTIRDAVNLLGIVGLRANNLSMHCNQGNTFVIIWQGSTLSLTSWRPWARVLHGPGLGPRAGPARSPWAGPGQDSMIFCVPGRVRAWNLQARAGPGLVSNSFAGCGPGLGLTFPGLGRAGPTVKVTLVLT